MRILVLSFLLAALALRADAAPYDTAGPEVLVSIKPIHSIIAAVMQGNGRVDVLLGGAESPHSHALRPMDAAKISHADVIFWVGPALEKFLVVPLAKLARHALVVALADAEGVSRLPARTGSLWESNTETDRSGGADGHIWLDPDNAIAIARAAAHVLGQADPRHARLYGENAEAFAARLMLLDARLAVQLEPARGRAYIVFHDGYQYFEAHYGLTPVGAVAVASDGSLDNRRVEELRARIKSTSATCLLSTRPISPRLAAAVTEGTQARTAAVEPLGTNIPRGVILYQTLLTRIAGTLVSCLGR